MKAELSEILESLSDGVAPAILSALEEATEARALVRPGAEEDGVQDLHSQLLTNRRNIERLEYLTAQFVLLKSRTSQAVAARKGAYDDAYMKAATKPSVGFGDFATAREKDAVFNLSAMDETWQLRKAESMHRDVDSGWDYCRILLRGAEGVQRDLETRIRLMSMQSYLGG